jgi:hypothetical protein
MKLEARHVMPYVVYGLKMKSHLTNEIWTLQPKNFANDWKFSFTSKPILRPLSDLTKEIIDEFQKYYNQESYDKDIIDLFCYENTQTDENIEDLLVTKLPYECVEYMFKNHYDVFGLIEKGLAIDFNETFTQK